MTFVFNLITIAIATNIIPFTTQAPYRGFDIQQEPYSRPDYDKPRYLLQELHNTDGSVLEELSNSVNMRSRNVKGKKLSGKKKLSKVHASVNGKTGENKPPVNKKRVYILDKHGKRYYYHEDQIIKIDGHLYLYFVDESGKSYYYGPTTPPKQTTCMEVKTSSTNDHYDFIPLRHRISD